MKQFFLLNAFSLQMVSEFPSTIIVDEVSKDEIFAIGHFEPCDPKNSRNIPAKIGKELQWVWDVHSAIGHQDTANILGVPMNRINITLKKGDVAYVAQLQGGRLPEGSTTLPEGFSFKFFKVEIQ